MKKFIFTSVLVAMLAAGTSLRAQDRQEDYLGLPGDNLNLYAVMKLFQSSKTLEEFERNLNDPNSTINNLDLNGDNLVDYIRVFDNVDGDVHNIVLQVAVSPRENQDVAVFTVQRFNNGQVFIQLTGDEDLYGKDYIIEPIFDETPNPGYTGPVQNVTYVRTTPVEVAAWPIVRFVYLPDYTVWRSSWYWGYYPSYWHPWRPFYWHYYYGYHYNWYNDYYGHYHRWQYHRYARWDDFYYHGHHSYSPEVRHRIEAGNFKTTYSHPEERKIGEARFAERHPEEYKRVTTVNSTTRRSSATVTDRSASGRPSDKNTGTTRRSTTIVTKKSASDRPSDNNAGTTRRSSTTINNKSASDRPSDNNAGTIKRSSNTINNKSASDRPSDNNAGTTRRSSTSVINRSATNPSSGQNAGSSRTTTKSQSTEVKSTSRRSNTGNKSVTTNKRESGTKESGTKENNRRK